MIRDRRTDELLMDVAWLQEVQRRNPPSSELWRRASAELAPLFEELAARQRAHARITGQDE